MRSKIKSILRFFLVMSLFFAFAAAQPARAADGVVQPPCNNAAFDTALNSVQGSGGGTITFNCGAAATIIFSTTRIITTPVTILGEGKITLSGGNAVRLFEVSANGILTLDDVTVSAGLKSDGNGGAILNYYGEVYIQNSRFTGNQTGALWSGGAIESFGKLVITDSEFTNNQAGNGGALFLRFEEGDATITNTIFRDNQTTNTMDGWGGVILLWDGADVTIEDSLLESNQAKEGGAIHNSFQNSSITLTDVTLSANYAKFGGGIFNTGTATMTGVTFSNNSTLFDGGGIYNDGTVTLTGVTLSRNHAKRGGGIINHGSATLTNVTLSSNDADWEGGGITNGDWMALKNVTLHGNTADDNTNGIYAAAGFIFLENTVIAGSYGENCNQNTGAHLISLGFNLSDDDTCSAYFNQVGDRNSMDAWLGALEDYGGLTLTHLPFPNSPLVDGGQCQASIPTDQRGITRPQGAACDIGAVERRANEQKLIYLPVVLR